MQEIRLQKERMEAENREMEAAKRAAEEERLQKLEHARADNQAATNS